MMHHDRLEPLVEGVWVLSAAQGVYGLKLGTRMTVVKLPSGGLWVHSPVAYSASLAAALAELGPIEHLVGPNLYHHLYLGEWSRAYPEALVHGAPGLSAKRSDMHFHHSLAPTESGAPWAEVFEQQHIAGCGLGEVVFFHTSTGTLISSDLIEHFPSCEHGPTRLYLKLSGVYGRPGIPRLVRLLYRDRAAARGCLDRVQSWEFDRIVFAHGELLGEGGREVLRQSYEWL